MAWLTVNKAKTRALLAAAILLLGVALPLIPLVAQEGLPADVRFDILKLELFEAARQERHKEILVITAKMRKIGQEMPESTPYFEARAFYALGATAMARRSLINYLKKTGRKGRDYEKAVQLFVKIKSEQDERARKAKAAADLRGDFETARAAWQAEKARAVQWKKHAVVFGGPGEDSATAITHTPEGGIIVAGAFHLRKTRDGKPLNATLPWITAFDGKGRRIWHRPLGTASDPGLLRSVVAIPGRGFLFGGAQKGFQIAAISDPRGNLITTDEDDPWIIGFAPASSGEGSIARRLDSGDIMALGTIAVSRDNKVQARLPMAVRLSPNGKPLGKSVLGRGSGALWYDVKDAIVLDGGDVVLAGETRRRPSDPSASAEGYLLRITPEGKEVWLKRITPSRSGGLSVTALTRTTDGGILAAGRDGRALLYFKLSEAGDTLWRKRRQGPPMPRAYVRLCAAKDVAARLTAAYGTTNRDSAQSVGDAEIGAIRRFACRPGKPFAAATAVVTRETGGFMILGLTGREGENRTRVTLTAIKENGAVTWQTSYGDTPGLLATDVLTTNDGGFVVAGVTSNWGRDVLLFKTDKRGRLTSFTALGPARPPLSKPAPKPKSTPPAPEPATEESVEEPAPSIVKAAPETTPKAAETEEETPEAKAKKEGTEKEEEEGEREEERVTNKPAPYKQALDQVKKTEPDSKAKPSTTPSDDAEYDLKELLDGLF